MQIIERVELKPATEWTIEMFAGSRIVNVDVVNGKPYMWIVNKIPENGKYDAERVHLYFSVDGVREDIPDGYNYVGTYIMGNGAFVGHLFAKKYSHGISR